MAVAYVTNSTSAYTANARTVTYDHCSMIARAWMVVIGDVPRMCPITRLKQPQAEDDELSQDDSVPHRRDVDVGAVRQVPSELVHQEDPDGTGENDRRDGEPEQPLDRTHGAASRQAHRRRPEREQRDHGHQQTDERQHLRRGAHTARVPHAAEVVGAKVQVGEEEGQLQCGVGGHQQPRAEDERAFAACDVLDGRQSGRACACVGHLMHRSARGSPARGRWPACRCRSHTAVTMMSGPCRS